MATGAYCSDSFGCCCQPVAFGQDGFGRRLADELLWLGIVLGEVSVDGGLEIDDRTKAAAPDAP